jgi:hypothetical protein
MSTVYNASLGAFLYSTNDVIVPYKKEEVSHPIGEDGV